ncbi:MAG: DUF1566 domain-containing protein [Desulfobacterales bacterium]|jgi:hypothetical protein
MIFRQPKTLGACLFLIAIGIYLITSPAFAATRGILVKTQTSSGSPRHIKLYSGYHALVVGCGNYRAGWPRLPHPVADAREVAATLKSMDWKVELLEDPGWDRLDTALNRLIAGPGRSKDKALLFWFSGHGHTLEEADGTKLGYIVPVDAPLPSKDEIGFMRRAIDMRQIETVAKRIRSKHVLMIFDSCFSGALFTMVRAAPSHYIEEKIAKPVREFITAGRENEKVPDRSVFKVVFIQGIKDGYADVNRDGYVTGEELGAYLQEKVINYSRKAQHPQFGKINNPRLDKGDFVFVLKRSQPPAPTKIDRKTTKKQKDTEAAQAEQMAREKEQLKALFAKRKKLEAERRRLEQEKQAIIDSQGKEIKTQTSETVTPKLAAIPEDVQKAKILLRKEPKILSRRQLKKMLLKFHFFDVERNPSGNFTNDFIANPDGTITDRITDLIWQKGGSRHSLLYLPATRYLQKLNREKFAGYSDWRLPTIEELASLMTRTKENGIYINSIFDNRQTKCWSADSIPMPGVFYEDWIISFLNGTITDARHRKNYDTWYGKDEFNYVRAVRSIK